MARKSPKLGDENKPTVWTALIVVAIIGGLVLWANLGNGGSSDGRCESNPSAYSDC